jgi:hypothetical protein
MAKRKTEEETNQILCGSANKFYRCVTCDAPCGTEGHFIEKHKINDGHYLELMDRLHIITCNLNDHCAEHPLAQVDTELKYRIEHILSQLWEVYQVVGNKSLK